MHSVHIRELHLQEGGDLESIQPLDVDQGKQQLPIGWQNRYRRGEERRRWLFG